MHHQGSRCIEFKFCLFNKVKVIQILVNCLRCITNTRVWWRILHSTRDSLRSSLVLCNILHHVRVLVIHLSQFTSISIMHKSKINVNIITTNQYFLMFKITFQFMHQVLLQIWCTNPISSSTIPSPRGCPKKRIHSPHHHQEARTNPKYDIPTYSKISCYL